MSKEKEVIMYSDEDREKTRGQMDFFKEDWDVYLTWGDDVKKPVKEALRASFSAIVDKYLPIAMEIQSENITKRTKN